uniref:RING-type domain-containing protein n=1 Tax=Arcella intermedia TaxID=1963864 RepID=A0A6B2LB29_9EUKA
MFLLSKTDRQIYISTGPGISHRLTDDDIHVIISNMKEGLRAGQFSDTIVSAVDEIRAVLLENKRAVTNEDSLDSVAYTLGGFFIVIFLFYQCSKRTPYSKCSRKLSLIERQAKAQKFDHSSCPICLEEFPKNIRPSHTHSQQPPKTTSTASTTSTTSNQKEVEILDCGHTFCKECIAEWFSSRRSEVCPICRAGEPSAPSKVPQSAEEEVFQNELRFRLLSLNRHYPTYVTTTMVDDWTRTNRNYNFHSSYTAFHNPPSSSGSGSSWGGGYSGGGGGGGGSW